MAEITEFTWKQIEEMCETLSGQINEKPDCIIGLARGGLPIARILSDILDIRDIFTIGVKRYTGNKVAGKIKVYQGLTAEMVDKKRILVVDDLVDHGTNMTCALDYLKKFDTKKIETATLFKKSWSKIEPDYYVQDNDSWIIFPWDKREMQREMDLKH